MWLDVFILDRLSKAVSYAKSDASFIAGHDLLKLVYQFDVPPDLARTITRRNYRGFNEHAFRPEIEVICHKALNRETASSSNVEVFPNLLSSVIVFALDRHAPLRTFRVHRPRVPSLTDTLRQRIMHRNSLFRRAERSGDILAMAIYRQCRDEFGSDLKLVHSNYLLARLTALTDVSGVYRELACLGIVRPAPVSPLNFFSPDELNGFF